MLCDDKSETKMVDQINICYQIPLFDRVNLIGVFFIVIVYMYLAVLRGCQVAWECAATQHSNLDDFFNDFQSYLGEFYCLNTRRRGSN